jgi:CDGSH-type Zn-finger protein
MATSDESAHAQKIIVNRDGPYTVQGNLPLVRKTQVVSEHGEPLTWKKQETLAGGETYDLCRCGLSHQKPFCDDSHVIELFDGTETAETRPTKERQVTCPGSTGILVRTDNYLCMDSGFCGTRQSRTDKMASQTADTNVRSQVIAMIERCPSGSLTYAMKEGEPEIEPDLPKQVAVTTEITSEGPIAGPLWVTGAIPIERADGQPFETRNRVTLCNCGQSKSKPLCDGTHRQLARKP